MAEEHGCQSPEGHHLCANNCGFFGSPATQNLCSKCYRDLRLEDDQASSAKLAVDKALTAAASSSTSCSAVDGTNHPNLPEIPGDNHNPNKIAADFSLAPPSMAAKPSRCATCRRRVGLTGFTCRCGTTFCGSHRYPEQHGCEFDFKAVGREAIAKANPVVKADKLEKI